MRTISFHSALIALLAVYGLMVCPRQALAQKEVALYGGLWIPDLADYRAGSIVSGGGASVDQPNLFQDGQISSGAQIGIKGLYRFLPTRTMLEFDANIAGADDLDSSATFADPNATQTIWLANLNGTNFLNSNNNTTASFSLQSDVLHYSEYIGLRDRYNLCDWGLGMFDLGCGFSHMGFEQDHQLDTRFSGGNTGQYLESVDTQYIGIDIRSTINKTMNRHPIKIDIALGIYDMDGDYDGTSIFRNGGAAFNTARVVDTVKDTAYTLTLGFRVEKSCRRMLIRPGVSFKYISDMVSINHPQTIIAAEPVSLTTDDAYLLGINLDILL